MLNQRGVKTTNIYTLEIIKYKVCCKSSQLHNTYEQKNQATTLRLVAMRAIDTCMHVFIHDIES